MAKKPFYLRPFGCNDCLTIGQCKEHMDDANIDYLNIEIHVRKHKSKICKACVHFRYLEDLQYENKNKLRIRNVEIRQGEMTINVVFPILQQLSTNLKKSDIMRCERVPAWDDRFLPPDIHLTFTNHVFRNDIFEKRNIFDKVCKNKVLIVDELIEQRVRMWRRAVCYFGHDRVTTDKGCVKVNNLYNETSRLVYTFTQLEAIIEENRSKVWEKFTGKQCPSTSLFLKGCTEAQQPSSSLTPTTAEVILWYITNPVLGSDGTQVPLTSLFPPTAHVTQWPFTGFPVKASNEAQEFSTSPIPTPEEVIQWYFTTFHEKASYETQEPLNSLTPPAAEVTQFSFTTPPIKTSDGNQQPSTSFLQKDSDKKQKSFTKHILKLKIEPQIR